MRDFKTYSDFDLVLWLAQYSGRQAGFYPGIRRSRVEAERVAATRGLRWWEVQSQDVRLWRTGKPVAWTRVIDVHALIQISARPYR